MKADRRTRLGSKRLLSQHPFRLFSLDSYLHVLESFRGPYRTICYNLDRLRVAISNFTFPAGPK